MWPLDLSGDLAPPSGLPERGPAHQLAVVVGPSGSLPTDPSVDPLLVVLTSPLVELLTEVAEGAEVDPPHELLGPLPSRSSSSPATASGNGPTTGRSPFSSEARNRSSRPVRRNHLPLGRSPSVQSDPMRARVVYSLTPFDFRGTGLAVRHVVVALMPAIRSWKADFVSSPTSPDPP